MLAAYEALIDFNGDGFTAATVESGATPRVPGEFANFDAARIEEGTTNLMLDPQGITVSGQYGTDGTNTLTENTTVPTTTGLPSGVTKCITATYQNDVRLLTVSSSGYSGLAAGAATKSVYVYIPTAYNGTDLRVDLVSFTGVTGETSVSLNMALRDQWQRVDFTPIFDAGDLVGNFRIREYGSAPTAGRLIYATAFQLEQKSYATSYADGSLGTGYSWSGTAHASTSARTAGAIAVSATPLSYSQGGAVLRHKALRASTTTGNGHRWTSRDSGGTSLMTVLYEPSTGRFRFESRVAGVSDFVNITKSYSAGDDVALAWYWTTTLLGVGVSVNGGAWTWATASRVAGTPTINATTVNIGTFYSGAPEYADIVVDVVATFSALSQAEAEAFAALTRPPLFGEMVGRNMVQLWLGEDSVYYDDARDIVGSDMYDVECERGRSYASQLTGRSEAGTLSMRLRNVDGRYSSFNASSDLYGLLLPNRSTRLRAADATEHYSVWQGFLDEIKPEAGSPPIARVTAKGALIRLSSNRIGAAASTGALTGTIVEAILVAAGLSASDYTVEAGQTTTSPWYSANRGALEALQEIEETELGFVYETKDGKIGYQDRHHRLLTTESLVSQRTFSDAVGAALPYLSPKQVDSQREIFNDFRVEVQKYSTAALAVLWTLQGETPELRAGESKMIEAVYPTPAVGGDAGAYVSAWTTPVVGTDITQTGVANGDIGVSVVKTSNSMQITITNNHATATATLTLVQARGTATSLLTPATKRSTDATSISRYGARQFTLPAKWLANTNDAKDFADYGVSRYKDPHPVMEIAINGSHSATMLAAVLTADLSHRVTVVAEGFKTKLGINEDFFVERVRFAVARNRVLTAIFTLSAATADGGYWTVGYSEVGVTTKVGY